MRRVTRFPVPRFNPGFTEGVVFGALIALILFGAPILERIP